MELLGIEVSTVQKLFFFAEVKVKSSHARVLRDISYNLQKNASTNPENKAMRVDMYSTDTQHIIIHGYCNIGKNIGTI